MRVQMHACRHMHVQADTLGFVSVHACLHPLCVTACIHACAHTHASAPMWRFTGAHTFTRHGERACGSVSACALMCARTRECARSGVGAAAMEADERLWQVLNAPGRLGGSWKLWCGGGRKLWPWARCEGSAQLPRSPQFVPVLLPVRPLEWGGFLRDVESPGGYPDGGGGEGPTWDGGPLGLWEGSVPS